MTKSSELQLLIEMINEAYARQAWHGPNLKGCVRGVSAKQAAWRPAKERHNIWEIVVHAAYWKYAVRRRLLGENRGSFPLKGSNWFKRPDTVPETMDEKAWRADIALLEEMHQTMCAAIQSLDPKELLKKSAGSKYTNARLIYGIACHDIYHAGQIQLLKRLQGE
jgi:uncharacterized damage-inducible protein DinB